MEKKVSLNLYNFWGSNYYNHPPLSQSMVIFAQKELGVTLPKTYIELLKIQNGGYTKGFIFPTTQKTSWADDHIPLRDLAGIVVNDSINTALNILDSPELTQEWELPDKQVLLSGEGHWWITIDFRKNELGSIMWFDVEIGQEVYLADNFDSFINGLKLE